LLKNTIAQISPIQKRYTIQEVADLLGIYKGTIKNYEDRKIFPKPHRNPINGYREYSQEDIEVLKKILLKGK
jgi:DNA-binding transcriptional MerR regulator